MSFPWIPIYQEIAQKILHYRERQIEVIEILTQLKNRGLPVIQLEDQQEDGQRIPLTEIDPFTFFSNFNRGIKDIHRIAILSGMKDLLQLREPIPDDFSGIPLISLRNAWYFDYQNMREHDDIPAL